MIFEPRKQLIMQKQLGIIALVGLACLANCAPPVDKPPIALKSGTVIDGYIYDGGPVSSSSSWSTTLELKNKLSKQGKTIGTRHTSPVSGTQYVSVGEGWRIVSEVEGEVPPNQRSSILLVIGSTVKAARDMARFEMFPGNPLTRNGFSDRAKYTAMMKDFEDGMKAIHKGGGVDAASSANMIKSTMPSSLDSDEELQIKANKRHRLLNAAASLVDWPNPFVTQSFLDKIDYEAKTQSETSPPRSAIKAPKR